MTGLLSRLANSAREVDQLVCRLTRSGIGQLAIRPRGQCRPNARETPVGQRPRITPRGLRFGLPTG